MKDVLLQRLCENCTPEKGCEATTKQLMKGTGLTLDQVKAILTQLNRLGFISIVILSNIEVKWILHLEGVDYWQRGGFAMQEKLLLSSVDKLLLELDKLQLEVKQIEAEQRKKLIPGMERIAAFGANILAFYQAINVR